MPTTLCPWLGDSDPNGPALPADLLVAGRKEGLPPLLLEELDHDLPTAPAVAGAARAALVVQLADEGVGALLDHGLELDILDVGKGEVEDLTGLGDDSREEAVEEDGMENG